MTLFESLIVGCWFIFAFVWLIFSFGAKNNIQGNDQKRSWIRLLVFTIIILLFNPTSLRELVGVHLLSSSHFVQGIGVVICVGGIAFAIWARIHLGTNWGMPMSQKEKPELVTTGPYRLVRHPIYTGFCIAMLGSAITGGLPWFIWFIFFSASFIYSAKKEERIMQSQFPNEYIEYMKHTKMIIPFIF